MSKSIKEGKLLYHLVPLDSFESIVQNGLMSRNELQNRGIVFTDTANHEILQERERLGLSDYVPFHFHIHTAYDTAVKEHHKDKEFIYMCVERDYAQANDFLILPIHPASSQRPELYKYEDGFNRIDWETMELKKGMASDENYRNLVRMAECVTSEIISVNHFKCIFVRNDAIKMQLMSIMNELNVPPYSFPNILINEKFF